VTARAGATFAADLSRETLALTTLGELEVGAAVNLEPALRAGDVLGGHLVSGHVDAIARITSVEADGRSRRLTVAVPADLMRYIARKGSVTLDGVSLTVNEIAGASFGSRIRWPSPPSGRSARARASTSKSISWPAISSG